MPSSLTESVVEEAALAWLEALGYTILHGPDIAPGMPEAERTDLNYCDVILERRLRQALERLNPNTLAVLHYTLLPKLISGDLRVPDAEQLMEKHV